jgi:cell fate (sporulation/competence/biofilm development) regulator YlbF (YheA/YmcA/DUF963 family)
LSVKEKAKDLALSIKESEEFRNLKSAEARLSLDPGAQDLLLELRQKQHRILLAQQTGQQIQEAEIKAIEQLQTQLKLNTTLQALQKAQGELEKLMQEVNETIARELAQ